MKDPYISRNKIIMHTTYSMLKGLQCVIGQFQTQLAICKFLNMRVFYSKAKGYIVSFSYIVYWMLYDLCISMSKKITIVIWHFVAHKNTYHKNKWLIKRKKQGDFKNEVD